MKELIMKRNIDIDDFFPLCYDLSENSSEEFKDFKEEFKFCHLIAILKNVRNLSFKGLHFRVKILMNNK